MFTKFKFTRRQTENYFKAASRDLKIARQSDVPEVIFRFSYDALLKLAIVVCAQTNLRVKSRRGHHIELIEKLAALLKDSEIGIIGDEMRLKRNLDLYGGGILISQKQASEYLEWVRKVFSKAERYLKKNPKLPI
ncbi:hypothetical protein KKD72_01030 [Patescibacteria group bacterium]|nr:hypothetical protein [Patescibacteria group bacterium]